MSDTSDDMAAMACCYEYEMENRYGDGIKYSSGINTHGLTMDRGKHAGKRYTRIPVSYLRWMVQVGHTHADIAKAEMDRRGTVIPEIEVSGHAIDSASLRCRKIWHDTSNKDEGLHAWLCRVALEAWSGKEISYHLGMKFVFESGEWPVLKTVMRTKHEQ